MFNINGTYTTINSGTALADGGDLTVSGTNTSSGTVGVSSETINIEQNTDYKVKGNIKSGLSSARIAMQFKENENDSWGGYRTIKTGIGAIEATVSSENYKFARFLFYCWTSAPSTATPAVFDEIMLSTSGGDYEKYTGGEAAPNPIYPYDIKSCGDNGSVSEKISNIKNFLNWNDFTEWSNWKDSLSSGYKYFEIDGLIPNTKYTLCRINDDGIGKYKYAGFNIMRNNSNLFIHSSDATSNKKSVTTTTDGSGKVYLVFYMSSATQLQNYINLIQDCWVIEGDSFIEKQEQTLSFPLAQGQKLMQGDYLADDGVHHVRGQVVFDDNNINKITNRGVYNDIPKAHINKASLGMNVDYKGNVCLMNKYKEITNTSQAASGKFSTTFDNGNIWVFDDRFTDLETARSLLIGTVIQFKLATEVIDPYTEEQKEAWEQIKKARTYKGGTHISSEDETPANVDIEYVVDVNTIYDRVTALENKINS